MIILLKKLIKCVSISPKDNKCQIIIKKFLKKIGFQTFLYKKKKVRNIIAIRYGNNNHKKLENVFLGHTDVVPKGSGIWLTDPFRLCRKYKKFYGRGVCDMKGAICSFLIATKFLLKKKIQKNLVIILTSDEEGIARYGTKESVKILKKKHYMINNCIIGEPTSEYSLGDVIKNGRRGSINITLVIYGIQGHTAYSNKSKNSIDECIIILNKIKKLKKKIPIDISVTNIITDNYITNIIPGKSMIKINIRYNKRCHFKILYKQILNIVKKNNSLNQFIIDQNSHPYYRHSNKLVSTIISVLYKYKIRPMVTRKIGGTSDGRYITGIVKNIVEIGHVNEHAHKINENIKIIDQYKLVILYYYILKKIS